MLFKALVFILGFCLIIAGISLVLREWAAVVMVFQGAIGALLAVAGLVILFASSIKK